MKSCAHVGFSLILATTLVAGCGGAMNLGRAASPWEQYRGELEAAGLDEAALGRDWIAAGERALTTAVIAELPFQETGYFPPGAAHAIAYQLDLRRGRRLEVDVTFETAAPGRLFVDLFEQEPGATPQRVASLTREATTLLYEVERDGAYLLRVQPELLRGGRYTIAERTLASLPFPVAGLSASAVQSSFGAARNGGSREHEGLDIFAPRGTPAVAVVDGVARADTNALGGNVIWLRDAQRGRSFYYAHLDRWNDDGTVRVRRGDVVGFVGNTGNARTASPHLHFGIYDDRPVDPLPYLDADDKPAARSVAPASLLASWVRVSVARAPLRRQATLAANPIRQLDRHTIAEVTALSARAVRVRLPDGTAGYLGLDQIDPASTALRRDRLAAGTPIRELPIATAPVLTTIAAATTADVLGTFGAFNLIRVGSNAPAWTAR